MTIERTTENKMTENQKKVMGKVMANWPEARIREHDAGCFSAVVEGELSAVSAMFPHPMFGVCVVPSRAKDGAVEIQW